MGTQVTVEDHRFWADLVEAARNRLGVNLTPDQVRLVLEENARLVEAKNEAVRGLWAQKEKEEANGTGRREAGAGDGERVP